MHPFTGRNLQSVDESDLEGLVLRAVPESLTLDYKQELRLNAGDKEKKEFLADVTSFANAEGGLILVGVEERRDNEGRQTGLPESLVGFDVGNTDELTKLIDALVRDGIEERLPGLKTRFVNLVNGQVALLIDIPQSPRAPHMVTLGKERRFYRRVNGGNEPMTTGQIRDAVLRTDLVDVRIRKFVKERHDEIGYSTNKPTWSLHLVPLFGHRSQLDLADRAVIARLNKIPPPFGDDHLRLERSHCLEGYRMGYRMKDLEMGVLVFRDGTIECTDQFLLEFSRGDWGGPLPRLHEEVMKCFENVFPLCREGVCPLPVMVVLALHKLAGLKVNINDEFGHPYVVKEFSSELVIAGASVIDDETPDTREVFRPMFDLIWQCAGLPRCPAYELDRKYVGYDKGNIFKRLDLA